MRSADEAVCLDSTVPGILLRKVLGQENGGKVYVCLFWGEGGPHGHMSEEPRQVVQAVESKGRGCGLPGGPPIFV